jgi:hypothetical protein
MEIVKTIQKEKVNNNYLVSSTSGWLPEVFFSSSQEIAAKIEETQKMKVEHFFYYSFEFQKFYYKIINKKNLLFNIIFV